MLGLGGQRKQPAQQQNPQHPGKSPEQMGQVENR